LYKTTIKTQFLQDFSDDEIHERVLYSYEKTMRQFLIQKEFIPSDNFIEMSYDELLTSPIETLEKVYHQFGWKNFSEVHPILQEYLGNQESYQRNKFSNLPKDIISEINDRWGFFFEVYGYEKQ
jgi:omega-hydroxy-beta-dihydromenaquinone-9 sulfotransferase